jgi:hypothetical protein
MSCLASCQTLQASCLRSPELLRRIVSPNQALSEVVCARNQNGDAFPNAHAISKSKVTNTYNRDELKQAKQPFPSILKLKSKRPADEPDQGHIREDQTED